MHVMGKKNLVVDMLSRIIYLKENEMLAHEEDGNLIQGFTFAISGGNQYNEFLSFKIHLNEENLRDIGLYLSTMKRQKYWLNKIFKDIR